MRNEHDAGRPLWLAGCCLGMSLVMALVVSCGSAESASDERSNESRFLSGQQSCHAANAQAQQHGDNRADHMCQDEGDADG